jgi:hypothetical protein
MSWPLKGRRLVQQDAAVIERKGLQMAPDDGVKERNEKSYRLKRHPLRCSNLIASMRVTVGTRWRPGSLDTIFMAF